MKRDVGVRYFSDDCNRFVEGGRKILGAAAAAAAATFALALETGVETPFGWSNECTVSVL